MSVNEPLARWHIPQTAGGTHELTASAGAVTIVVGPNGTGKSSLGHWLEAHADTATVRRLIAHRRLWLQHPGPAVTSAQRNQLQAHMVAWSRSPDSRWLDHAHNDRADVVLFDLMARENERNARIARLVDVGTSSDAICEEVERSFLTRITEILRAAYLQVELILTKNATFDARSVDTGVTYPISEMSDGEKSALLLAAEVLVAPTCVQIIDEPERHLHRSISAGLISAILAERSDCHFVVLTHDLDLASALAEQAEQVLLLASCAWEDGSVSTWEINLLGTDQAVPDGVRRAILGGKSRLLFVEGTDSSLDGRLYSLLFPDWDVVPCGGCEQVLRAVSGMRATTSYHWVDVRGIIDRDGRDEIEAEALRKQGILVLPVHEIESIYYLPEVISGVAAHHAAAIERDSEDASNKAVGSALAALSADQTRERLASKLSAQILARQAISGLPNAEGLLETGSNVTLHLTSPLPEQLECYRRLLDERNLTALVERFPIRETGLPTQVAQALGFRCSDDYEAAVRTRLANDEELAATVGAVVGELP